MGTFHTDCTIENAADRSRSATVSNMLVDTGSDYTWLPAAILERIGIKREKKDVSFVMANGQHISRNVGFAIVRSGEFFTVDEVVFAEEGDLSLLGARSLEGFNARVDSKQKKLVAAGPLLAAVASDRQVAVRMPEGFCEEFVSTLAGMNRRLNVNVEEATSTASEKQHLRLTLANGETHWVTEIIHAAGKPLLGAYCENVEKGTTYRLVVPKSAIVSFEEIPQHQLVQEPKPRIGFNVNQK